MLYWGKTELAYMTRSDGVVSPRFAGWPLGGGGCLGRLSQEASAANGPNDTPEGIIALKLPYKCANWLLVDS
jgi:hypothetical protein